MSAIQRARIERYDALSHTADVELLVGPGALLSDVPVLMGVEPRHLAPEREVAVLLWPDVGALVLGPYGAAPGGHDLVDCGCAHGSALGATTSWQTFLSVTRTVEEGRLQVTAAIQYTVGATAGYDLEARLLLDGVQVSHRRANLHAAYQADELTLSWAGALPLGVHTWKVEVRKNNAAPVVTAEATSEMTWMVFA
ncbi:MAG: hypothetical protein ACYC4R_17025 [Anaerolineae bacterium]